ncbi:unnamed protein product [Phytophthora lilii]|uniref:Unnamed protein product n=1 Tax=Phytophthora lilii TaxID=2077276 RepID=A0A9W7CPZ3_9STRA|nr:unnamed protein product [Phytophthora lilii]
MTFFWRRVAEEDIEFLEKRLRHNLDMLFAKKKRLALELRASARRMDDEAGAGKKGSLLARALGFFSSTRDDTTCTGTIAAGSNAAWPRVQLLRLCDVCVLRVQNGDEHGERGFQAQPGQGPDHGCGGETAVYLAVTGRADKYPIRVGGGIARLRRHPGIHPDERLSGDAAEILPSLFKYRVLEQRRALAGAFDGNVLHFVFCPHADESESTSSVRLHLKRSRQMVLQL